MAEQTTSSIVISADPLSVMAVISDFASYPVWAQGVKKAEPLPGNGTGSGRPEQVHFELDAGPIKDAYTLRYHWDADRSVSWTLVEGRMLKAMDGAYELDARPDGSTEVTYRLAVDISIPMIGMLKRKAEKVIIDTALKGLKKRVESIDRP
jgi:Polyketide cyclase / dehydrase and lipid transport